SCRRIGGVGIPEVGAGEALEVDVEGTVFVGGAPVGVGAVPLPREMGLATADVRMKMATTRTKAALATRIAREREELTADEGLRERLDMRASFLLNKGQKPLALAGDEWPKPLPEVHLSDRIDTYG